jgi:DedD protein
VTDLSHDAADDGFHEIQLSGKQLVFLFMATTVVSVVIFLCGVLVGRGVRGDTVRAEATPPATSGAAPTPTKADAPPSPPVDTAATRPLTYQQRLDSATPVQERLKRPESAAAAPETSKPVVEPAPAAKEVTPAPKPAPPTPATASTPPPSAKPGVWAVQVVALTDKAAASAVVQRLSAKGYPAFLVSPQSGGPVQNYKVQVGKFEDRSEAEQIAGRLKKEEQFQPWILR